MTNTETTDVSTTTAQIVDLWKHGAQLVRIAVPTMGTVKVLPFIREATGVSGRYIPLVADIHFSPDIAYAAIPYVDKIRINPGNLFERSRSRKSASIMNEIHASRELEDLLVYAAENEKAVRIGVNQGSLSRRIMKEYGDGVEGIVQSAVEYIRTARKTGFERLIISLKSSDPWIVVDSHRMLAEQGFEYPFHVGVTEAGWGLQGRARSAAGIGVLLRGGLADTIRVSLAENPVEEIPVAKALVGARRSLLGFTGHTDHMEPRGVQTVSQGEIPPDYSGRIRVGEDSGERILVLRSGRPHDSLSLYTVEDDIPRSHSKSDVLRLPTVPRSPGELAFHIQNRFIDSGLIEHAKAIQLPLPGGMDGGHDVLGRLLDSLEHDIIWEYGSYEEPDRMRALTDLAELYDAGKIAWLEVRSQADPAESRRDGLDILQGLGTGKWCAELIACPQCGRSSIDVPALIRDMRSVFGHLRGLKLAVMGCIVNGPGEMEGADYGCVGSGKGTVVVYARGKVAARAVPVADAVERLGELILQDAHDMK